jgi:hypothetical protein
VAPLLALCVFNYPQMHFCMVHVHLCHPSSTVKVVGFDYAYAMDLSSLKTRSGKRTSSTYRVCSAPPLVMYSGPHSCCSFLLWCTDGFGVPQMRQLCFGSCKTYTRMCVQSARLCHDGVRGRVQSQRKPDISTAEREAREREAGGMHRVRSHWHI